MHVAAFPPAPLAATTPSSRAVATGVDSGSRSGGAVAVRRADAEIDR